MYMHVHMHMGADACMSICACRLEQNFNSWPIHHKIHKSIPLKSYPVYGYITVGIGYLFIT